jgi:hypothetical protein
MDTLVENTFIGIGTDNISTQWQRYDCKMATLSCEMVIIWLA